MNDLARKRLCDLLTTYGPAICNTPRSCEMFIRQSCSDCPDELQLFTKALHGGTVKQLLHLQAGQDWDKVSEPLVAQFVESAGVTPEVARWTVDSWALALRKHPDGAAAPPPPPMMEPPKRLDVRTNADNIGVRLTISAAISGGIGGLIGGMLVGAIYELIGKLGATFLEGADTFGLITAIMAVVSGVLAGASGAACGWFVIGGHRPEDMPADGSLPRWVIQGYLGACGGALTGAALGGWLCHPIFGIWLWGFVGGFTGTFTGVLNK
jgi:hypothetical protein